MVAFTCNLCFFIPIYYAFVHVKSQCIFLVCDITSHFFKTGSFSSCITFMFMLVVCSLDDTLPPKWCTSDLSVTLL